MERGDVRLRDGAGDFLVRELEGERGRERERDKGGGNGEGDRRIGRIDIISVNWSQRFIASSLEAAVPALQGRTCCAPSYSYDGSKPAPVHSQTATDHNNAPTSNSISVFANELSGLASNHPSTGILCAPSSPRIITSLDKLAHLQNLRNLSPATDMPLVYVGDSRTDLECLLAADDGICMRDEPMGSSQRELRDVVAGLGFACVHVGEWRADGAGGGRKVVGWARDFREIEDWARERWKWK